MSSFNFSKLLTGTYDAERIKQGAGTYQWMGPTSEDDDTPMELARFEGLYKDGQKTGYGKMVYPNGDIYEGEWFENKVTCAYLIEYILLIPDLYSSQILMH